MSRLDLRSREYKMMLRPERFAGDEDAVKRSCAEFWGDVGAALAKLEIPTEGQFDRVKARRRIRFLDTSELSFRAHKYVLRERVDVDSGEREVTLKYRHADRYLAADRDMEPTGGKRSETKFEEDVKPPFASVFSYSTTVEIEPEVAMTHMGHIRELFPGFGDEVPQVDDGRLLIVRNFCANELVLVGASVLLGKRDIGAECAMVVWHDSEEASKAPVCVEFSFKYGDDDEDYAGTVTRDAHDLLQVLPTDLPAWVHPNPVTKTSFVYGGAAGA